MDVQLPPDLAAPAEALLLIMDLSMEGEWPGCCMQLILLPMLIPSDVAFFSGMGYHRESVTNLTYEDIPDLSDDDHIEGEEPMLESMAEARRGGGMSNFPITVTSSARSKKVGASGGHNGDVSPSPSSYGMTLEQYITQMVTTPASAAATSGIWKVCHLTQLQLQQLHLGCRWSPDSLVVCM